MADEDDIPVTGAVREKLVARKEDWAREGRLLTGTPDAQHAVRLPPGQTEVKHWPVLDLGIQPDVAKDKFRLRLEGQVEQRVALDWTQFNALEQVDQVCDIHCVTQWSLYDAHFTGVRAKTLLAMARPRPAARFISFTSYDGYTTNIPLAAFDDDDVLLAHAWNGEPLTREHGAPVRVILPKLYFWKSPKWVTRIDFLTEDRPGFWEVRGYHNNGDPWLEERYG